MSDHSLERFASLQGMHFFVQSERGEMLETQLMEARALSGHNLHGRQPFSLLFKGPVSPVLQQSVYQLVSDGDPEPFDIFLVPVSLDASGACYEAVFN